MTKALDPRKAAKQVQNTSRTKGAGFVMEPGGLCADTFLGGGSA